MIPVDIEKYLDELYKSIHEEMESNHPHIQNYAVEVIKRRRVEVMMLIDRLMLEINDIDDVLSIVGGTGKIQAQGEISTTYH